MTMNRFFFFIAVAFLIATATSCEQDMDFNPDSPQEVYQVGFKFKVEPVTYTMTRAENINAGETDDFIDRIDMYEYKKDGELIKHEYWHDPAGLDLSIINPKSYDLYDNDHTWVFFANLDPDSAEYLAGLNADEIGEMPTGIIPLSAGNFRLHKPLMGGTAQSDFRKDETISVVLYRYLTRIEISSIKADFDDPSLYDKDVKIKRIALTNYTNALRLLNCTAKKVGGSFQNVLGVGYTKFSNPAFGNLYHMDNSCNDWEMKDSRFQDGKNSLDLSQYGGKGKLLKQYPYILNRNMKLQKGELLLDVEDDQYIASVHEFAENEGILCSATDKTLSNIMDVNKVFYTIPVDWSYRPILYANWASQDDIQKLVIEADIDGISYFYIISLCELNAGMIYKVGNINLKSLGSEYSNIYEEKVDPNNEAAATISGIREWSETELAEMNVGYTVDSYDIYGYE